MSATDLELQEDGYWVWDNNFDGIAFISLASRGISSPSLQVKTKAAPLDTSLFNDIRLTFVEVPKAQELLRFRRHIQRRTNPQDPVILRDIKDVVIFQVKQKISSFFLDFFYTPEVDYFLRCLILYFVHYIQVWEWMSVRAGQHGGKIRIAGLRPPELHERENLAALRLLAAAAYSEILLGYGETKRFHHTYNILTSWTQRDVRMWEWLIRISARIVWVVFQKRHLNLIKAEMDRLFRSESYVFDARKSSPLFAAVLQSLAGSTAAAMAPKAIGDECPPDHSKVESPFNILSPMTRELKYGDYNWKLSGVGRVNLEDKHGKLEGIIQLVKRTEEYLEADGKVIGILGMPHSEVDTMLTVITKRPPETRPLTDVLQDMRDFFSHETDDSVDLNMCMKKFPRDQLEEDIVTARELHEARVTWRNNYQKVKAA